MLDPREPVRPTGLDPFIIVAIVLSSLCILVLCAIVPPGGHWEVFPYRKISRATVYGLGFRVSKILSEAQSAKCSGRRMTFVIQGHLKAEPLNPHRATSHRHCGSSGELFGLEVSTLRLG